MRFAILAATALCIAAPVYGQHTGHAGHGADVSGGGKLPAGWQARRDKMPANAELSNVKVEAAGAQAFRVTMGQTNATLWNPSLDAKGEFDFGATFTTVKAGGSHPEGYGLVFNGANLDKADQSYIYFLIRNGQYLINHRAGEEIHKIVPWTTHAAIQKPDASGKSVNKLSVQVKGNDVNYMVNGQVVHRQDRSYVKPDGIVGMRVNMHVDVNVSEFALKPAAK